MLNIGILTSNRAPGLDGLRNHPLRGSVFEIASVLNRRPPADKSLREWYDAETADMFIRGGADYVVLLGYGVQKYPGLHATRNAIAALETETHSIVHVVTKEVDSGPVIVQSDPFIIAPFAQHAVLAGETDIVRAYAYAHREWMMRSCWGDLVVQALFRVVVREEVAV
jgi:hypothetical protein